MKQINKAGGASGIVAGAVLAFLVSGCTGSPDPVVRSSGLLTGPSGSSAPSATISPKATATATSAPRTSATAPPEAKAPTPRVPVSRAELGPAAVHVFSAKLAAGTLTVALQGPQDSTFRMRSMGGTTANCSGQKGKLDARAPKGSPANSVQHYTLTCGEMAYGKKPTLLTTSSVPDAQYQYETLLAVTT